MPIITNSAGWVAPGETSGWISPSEVVENSGWVSPYESAGWISPYESAGIIPPYESGQTDVFGGVGSAADDMQLSLGMTSGAEISEQQTQKAKGGGMGGAALAAGIVSSVIDPVTGLIKWFSGGQEVSAAQAQAEIEKAKASAEMAKAQALMALKTKPKGIDTQTILLIGGGALALYFLLK